MGKIYAFTATITDTSKSPPRNCFAVKIGFTDREDHNERINELMSSFNDNGFFVTIHKSGFITETQETEQEILKALSAQAFDVTGFFGVESASEKGLSPTEWFHSNNAVINYLKIRGIKLSTHPTTQNS